MTYQAAKKARSRLTKLNDCLLGFSAKSEENIQRLTSLCGEILGGTCAHYNRLHGGQLCSWGKWKTPPDFIESSDPKGHICTDVVKKGGDDVVIIPNLPQTKYFESDPAVSLYQLKTYVGCAVKSGGNSVGSLCVVFQDDFDPNEEDKEIVRILASAISTEEERLQSNRAISEVEGRLKLALEGSGHGIWEWNLQNGYLFYSYQMLSLLGYQPGEYAPHIDSWKALLHPEDTPPTMAALNEHFEGRSPYYDVEYRLRKKNGDWHWFAVKGKVVNRDEKGVPLFITGTFDDINERKNITKILHESEEKYRSLFQNMLNGFAYHEIIIDDNGQPVDYVFLEVNDAFEELTGLKRENIINNKVTEALPGIKKDSADWIGRYGKVALSGIEERFEQHSGPLGKWFSVYAFSPKKNFFAVIFEDVTERKKLEKEKENIFQQLIQSEKLASLGEMAAGIAHELNTPLNVIIGYLQLLEKKLGPQNPYKDFIDTSLEASEQCRLLIGDVLLYARPSEASLGGTKEPAKLEEIVQAAIKLSPMLKKQNIKHAFDFPEGLPDLNLDPKPLIQIFVNLIKNSVQAMPKGGDLTVSAQKIQKKDSSREWVEFQVIDTGVGIPKENISKVFDPFFTTKRPGKGTGLGLAICARIMESYGGTMTVESEVGQGTNITGEMPL